jgi:hypothetical protein
MGSPFTRATRKRAKLRLGLTGPSGSGKTLSALRLAAGLGGAIAVLDTEHDSASLYSEPFSLRDGSAFTPPEFDAMSLSEPYTPERYIDAIRAAESAGYAVLIIDSITHEWSGSGGCLALVDEIARARYRGNSWSAWNDVTPRHRALLDAILQSTCHVIVTLRSKTETAQQEGNNGRKTVVKLGMKAEQRDGFEYEMTTVFDLSHDGNFATATKDRTGLFMGRDPLVLNESVGQALGSWLSSGVEPPARVAPEPAVTREREPGSDDDRDDHGHDHGGHHDDPGVHDATTPLTGNFQVQQAIDQWTARLNKTTTPDAITALVNEVAETLSANVPAGFFEEELAAFKRTARGRWYVVCPPTNKDQAA